MTAESQGPAPGRFEQVVSWTHEQTGRHWGTPRGGDKRCALVADFQGHPVWVPWMALEVCHYVWGRRDLFPPNPGELHG